MFENMKKAYNISVGSDYYTLNDYENGDSDLYNVVVQKGNIGQK